MPKRKLPNIRFIDLFGGIGGFRLGLEKANKSKIYEKQFNSNFNSRELSHKLSNTTYQCVGYYDIDKYTVKIYNRNFNENHGPTDIRQISSNSIPNHDLLCAGFPCQAFSIAGKRKGFQDTRGTLFFEIARILGDKKPRLCLLENVKGLLNHDGGNTFGTILQTLDELGYNVEWQVLNSKFFGVPQNRERVFIIGHLRGCGGREIFPITESNILYDEHEKCGERISSCLDANYYKGARKQRQAVMVHNVYGGFKEKEPRVFKDVSPMIHTPKGGGHLPMVKTDRIRRLTPIECERLQGFPDNWTSGVSDTQRYKCLGNAVTVNVIEFLGKRLMINNERDYL